MFVVSFTSTMQLILLAMWVTIQLRQTKEDGEASGQPDSNYSMVTCNFQDYNYCGWKNLNSNDGWNIVNYYAVLDVSDQSPGFTGRLASPWLQALPGYTCWLQFRYYINYNNRCSLTVTRQTELSGAENQIWTTTNESYFTKSYSVQVECTEARYRIIFEGKRLGDDPCGTYNGIGVDDIAYYRDLISTSVAQSWPEMMSWSTRSSTEKGINDNATLVSHNQSEGSKRGLDTASLAAIIVAVMAVLIVAAIFVIILLCLRRKNGKNSIHWLEQCFKKRPKLSPAVNVPRAVTNTADGTDEGQVLENAGGSVKPKGKYDSIYVYTEADDNYSKLSGDKFLPSAAARAVPSYDNVDDRKGPGDLKTAGQGHVQDDNVYSLTRNDGVSSAEETAAILAKSGTTDYEIVDMNSGFHSLQPDS